MAPTPRPVDDDAQTEQRRRVRRDRARLLESLWKVSTLPSVKGCGRSVRKDAGAARLLRGADGRAAWGEVNTCGSVSACPECSPRERQAKAATIEAAGVAHLRRGGGLAFGTMTMRHRAGMRLVDLLAAERAAWKAVREDQRFRLHAKALGARYVRAWEFTYTDGSIGGNGWHPHLHVLWFFDTPLTDDERLAFLEVVTDPWIRSLQRAGYGIADQFDLQLVEGKTNAVDVIRYLTKVQDDVERNASRWGVGAEMARGDLKAGKRKKSRTPFQLLAAAVGQAVDDDGRPLPAHGPDLALWQEYEQATLKLRVVEPSRGLYAALDVVEVLAEDDLGPQPREVAATVCGADYRLVCRRRLRTWFVDLVENGGGQVQVDEALAALRRGEVHRARVQRRRDLRPVHDRR